MLMMRGVLTGLATLLVCVTTVQAHFLWIVTEPGENPKTARIYFSEEAAPDDPALLKSITAAKAWVLGERGEEPQLITLKIDGDALAGPIPEKLAKHPVVLNHTYGVAAFKGPPFLLKYYGKAYPSKLPGSWTAINRPEILPLEVTPSLKGSKLTLTVTWQGKPAAGCLVTVEGPGLKEPVEGDSDAEGKFTAEIPQSGLFSIRARMIEEIAGELDGKKYEKVNHYSTLGLPITLTGVVSRDQVWPPLVKGMTSFGAAVAGDALYVYGGHLGGAHEYHEKDQSNAFLRLPLTGTGAWESLPAGPRRTGLAMVAHQGKLYRIGGFEVTGDGSESLASRTDFVRFDPAVGQWEELAPLPEGRSSHDAVVIGDTLYVVGGWELKPGADHDNAWLKTAWSCDLSQARPEWKSVTAPPFQRRALSLGARDGLLYAVGGMQPNGEVTTQVDVYDPAKGTWSEGPALLGGEMDGFGSATHNLNGQLIATTLTGSIQRLAADGSHWEYLGQLSHPRFFHEIAPWNNQLVVVGGASMQTGKALQLESVTLPANDGVDQKAALK